MKTKQIIGIVVAALMFILICVTSMATKNLFSDFGKDLFNSTEKTSLKKPTTDYVGILRVEGGMTTEETSSSIFGTVGYSHSKLIETIEDYMYF